MLVQEGKHIGCCKYLGAAWPFQALLWLFGTTLLAQTTPTIRVPVRLVSVPTLVLAPDGHTLPIFSPPTSASSIRADPKPSPLTRR